MNSIDDWNGIPLSLRRPICNIFIVFKLNSPKTSPNRVKMPNPTCVQCSTNDSLLWRNVENGQICNECHITNNVTKEVKVELTAIKIEKDDDDLDGKNEKDSESTPAKATGKGTRKSTRATRYKSKTPAPTPNKPPAPRGRGRRSIFKRQPLKAPTATATVVTSDSIFYKVLLRIL